MTERTLTAEDLASEPVDIIKVKVDDAGGVMFIGSITADEFTDWNDAKNANAEAKKTAAAKLIVRSLVKGPVPTDKMTAGERAACEQRIGTDAMVAPFRKTKMIRVEKLIKAITKLNGINEKDEADVKNG